MSGKNSIDEHPENKSLISSTLEISKFEISGKIGHSENI